MANITRFGPWKHLRSEPSFHVMFYRGGKLRKSGRGVSSWFLPLSASIVEIPCEDLDQPFLFHARSSDFQDVTTQGAITYRVEDPELLASRVDFSIDLKSGRYRKKPLERLSEWLTQRAQELAWAYLAQTSVRELLAEGVEAVRERIDEGLVQSPELEDLGLVIVGVSVSSVAPTPELEKALQAPTREAIQQLSDEATFQRRALAVEKERAIQENELQNQIELARREEDLIIQRGQNDKRRTLEEAEAARIAAESTAGVMRLETQAKADGIREVERARVESEAERMAIYRDMPTAAIVGLAAQELAGNLPPIEHLNLSPDLLTPLLSRLIEAGTARLGPQDKN